MWRWRDRERGSGGGGAMKLCRLPELCRANKSQPGIALVYQQHFHPVHATPLKFLHREHVARPTRCLENVWRL